MPKRNLDDWLWQIGSELELLSEEITSRTPKLAKSTRWHPRVDLYETPKEFVLRAELAGCSAEEIRITFSVERNSIFLRGHREPPDQDGRQVMGFHQLEIPYGEFEREIQLPRAPLLLDQIRGMYRNGFLVVIIPKLARTTRRRTITTITIKTEPDV